MHRLLERLDNAASSLVPLLYLAGLMVGAAAYFAGVTLDAGLAVGGALATAAELHSFLQQRRLRASWAQLQRTPTDAPEHDATLAQVKVNAAILAALLAFSAYNAIAFAAATWRPSPGFLPPWLQIAIRGLVVPIFFFLSGFLAPLQTDASDQLRATSSDMLRRTLRAIGRQWRSRLDDARSRRADLAPVAVALMRDAGDEAGARRVALIAEGLASTETAPAEGVRTPPIGQASAALTTDGLVAATPAGAGSTRPPTGGGTPTGKPRPRQRPVRASGDVLRMPSRRPTRPGERVAARASVEPVARAAWRPGMSVTELERAAKISRTAARTYRAKFTAEEAAAGAAGGKVAQ